MTRVPGAAPHWTPYMHGNNLWISYDDPTSVAKKTSLVNSQNLGGIMVWSLEKDDQTGVCDKCPFPLMRAINNAVGRNVSFVWFLINFVDYNTNKIGRLFIWSHWFRVRPCNYHSCHRAKSYNNHDDDNNNN